MATAAASPKLLRLAKSRQIMRWANHWYRKKGRTLPPGERAQLEQLLRSLDEALFKGDRQEASRLAHKLEAFVAPRNQSSYWIRGLQLFLALVGALIAATVIRQSWLEHQEIPSGSMRPTYREEDHLFVSKMAYGINMPFTTNHFYFDPSLLPRTSIFTFSADQIPMEEGDSTYLGLFPYKKRLIKRMMGKPGDLLYFYGGRLYGIDSEGRPIEDYQKASWLKGLEYIPFMTFEGEVHQVRQDQLTFSQMNQTLGRLLLQPGGKTQGEILVDGQWRPDQVEVASGPHSTIETYSDFWGIRNFAMVQLLSREQLSAYRGKTFVEGLDRDFGRAELYLEMRHTPSLTTPAPRLLQGGRGLSAELMPFRTYLPLGKEELQRLMDSLYTARFVVLGGQARRYSASGQGKEPAIPLPGVADGTYEFYRGQASKVSSKGWLTDLPKDSPLYSNSPQQLQLLFNLGIDWHPIFQPKGEAQLFFPHRYGYFRDGDLYVMGSPLLKKGEERLVRFQKREEKLQADALRTSAPYVAFRDWGPPLQQDGTLDVAFLKTFGLQIPAGHYLALGDNHAMSGDSRVWGFVPEANVQGAPSFLYWPPGDRWGSPKAQPPLPWFTLPRLVVLAIVAAICLALLLWRRHTHSYPLFRPDNLV